MPRLLQWVGGLFTLFVLAAPARAQSARSPIAALAGDDRLQKPIIIQRRFVVLDEVLRQIGKATDVSLRASGRIASENVVVLAANRPAAEILETLTETLGYRWRKLRSSSGKFRYELYQEEKAIREEERQRLEHRREALRRMLELARLKCLPEGSERQAALDALERREQGQHLTVDERHAIKTERDLLRPPADDGDRALLGFLPELWPQMEEQLLNDETARFSSSGEFGTARLPVQMARRIRTEVAKDARWTARLAAAPRTMEVRLKTRVDWGVGRATLSTSWDLDLPPATELGEDARSYRQGSSFWVAFLSGEGKGEGVKSEDPRLQQQVQVQEVKKYDPPRLVREDPSTYFTAPLPVDLFAQVHAAHPEISFVGDAYLTPMGSLPKSGRTLDVLNEAVLGNGSNWRWDPRGYVLLRSRNVPYDRIGSVSATFFQALYQRAAAHRGVTLADYAWVAASLSDEQIRRLAHRMRPMLTMMVPNTDLVWYPFYEQRYALRLFASLTSPQQRALTKRGLRASELSRAQLELLQADLDADGTMRTADLALSDEVLPTFALTLTELPNTTPKITPNLETYRLAWLLKTSSEPVLQITVTLNHWPKSAKANG